MTFLYPKPRLDISDLEINLSFLPYRVYFIPYRDISFLFLPPLLFLDSAKIGTDKIRLLLKKKEGTPRPSVKNLQSINLAAAAVVDASRGKEKKEGEEEEEEATLIPLPLFLSIFCAKIREQEIASEAARNGREEKEVEKEFRGGGGGGTGGGGGYPTNALYYSAIGGSKKKSLLFTCGEAGRTWNSTSRSFSFFVVVETKLCLFLVMVTALSAGVQLHFTNRLCFQ